MTHVQITVKIDSGPLLVQSPLDQTLLELMQELLLPVRQACRNGSCGICKCRLETGQINYFLRAPFGLMEQQIEQGFILPCIAYPASDLVLNLLTVSQKQD